MFYRKLESLLFSHGWNGEEDEDGDMHFTRGDAGLWVQWDDPEDSLDDAYMWAESEQEEWYICNICRLIFTQKRMTIIWGDGTEWNYYYDEYDC